MTAWRAGARTLVWWLATAAGVALVAADAVGQTSGGVANTQTALFLIAMSAGTVSGLWVWAWRPRTRMGPLMYLWPTAFIASDLVNAYPGSRVVSTFGLALLGMGPIIASQMYLAYPTGKLEGRLAWFYIFWMGYLAQTIQNVFNMLYYDPRSCSTCSLHETTYLHVGQAPFSFDWWNKGWWIQIICVLPIGLYLITRRYLDAGPGARRSRGPILAIGFVGTCLGWIQLFLLVLGDYSPLTDISYVTDAGYFAVALTVFVGLFVTHRARSAVADLVVELGRGHGQGARAALARAIGDPTLELALWLPDRGVWADERGNEVVLPQDRDRAVTMVGADLAAIVHDPIFLDQPSMLEAVGEAARFALENERLQAQMRAQLAELRESRARVVRVADDERRRLERDLHDGAQQRLLGLGMALQLLRTRVGTDADTVALLQESESELQQALAELRELARGIYPAVLVDQGLGAAVRTLADRSPVPVEVKDAGERLPPRVEAAAYYVIAEALANVARYSGAGHAWVSVGPRQADRIRVEIGDDGIGGAAPQNGSGLRGLSDRVGALDGVLTIKSPPGDGTCVVAEFPCAS